MFCVMSVSLWLWLSCRVLCDVCDFDHYVVFCVMSVTVINMPCLVWCLWLWLSCRVLCDVCDCDYWVMFCVMSMTVIIMSCFVWCLWLWLSCQFLCDICDCDYRIVFCVMSVTIIGSFKVFPPAVSGHQHRQLMLHPLPNFGQSRWGEWRVQSDTIG